MSSAAATYEQLPLLPNDSCEQVLLQRLPQVRYIARRIHDHLPAHVPLEDLVHAGVIGLMDAMRKYDAGKRVQFQSYAKFRIRGAILDSLREMDWSPRDLRRQARHLEEVEQRLRSRTGRTPSDEEIAGAAGLSLRKMHELRLQLRGLDVTSLEATESNQDDSRRQFVPASPAESPLQQCLHAERRQMLLRLIAGLPERERQVLWLYYYQDMSMREVGQALGVGESRVSQLHSSALMRLRERQRRRNRHDP